LLLMGLQMAAEATKKGGRGGLGKLIVIVVVIGLVTWLTWPDSGFRIYIEQSVVKAGLADDVVSISNRGAGRAERFAKHHRYLAFRIDSSAVSSPIPGVEFGGALKPGDLLTLDAKINVDVDYIAFEGKVDLDGLIERAQRYIADKFFSKPTYHFVVQEYKSEPIANGGEGHQLVAFLYPNDRVPHEIPVEGGASDDALSDEVAWYLFSVFTPEAADCAGNLCLDDLSPSLASLETTVSGFDILIRSSGHPACDSLQREACMNKAERDFRAALIHDPDNDHAHLGLGLIEMQRARDAADQGLSAYTVGAHFISGIRELHQARITNYYIRGLLDSEAWGEMLANSAGYRGLDLSPAFLGSAFKYEEARRAMVETRYDRVVQLVDQVQQPPKWMEGHLISLRTLAELRLVKTRDDALVVLRRLDDQKETVPIELWAPIFGLGAAEWAGEDEIWRSKARAALDLSVDLTREREARLSAEAHRARGLIFLDEIDTARSQLQGVESIVQDFENDGQLIDIRSIGFELAMAYTALGEFPKAAEWLDRIIDAEPLYLRSVQDSPYLSRFRSQWPEYRNWLLKKLP
jgi:tetratricopeptide (TPR) repeat protein